MFTAAAGLVLRRTQKPAVTPVHRLWPGADDELLTHVVERYTARAGFRVADVRVDGLPALLVTGTITPGPADRCGPLAAVTGRAVAEENRTAMGLLLVRTDRSTYALTYGAGTMLVDPGGLDPAFGVAIALRCIDEDQLTPIRRDVRGALVDSVAAPVRYGAVVGHIAERLAGVRVSYSADRSRAARVADAGRTLSVRRHRTPVDLNDDLARLDEIASLPDPIPELVSLDTRHS